MYYFILWRLFCRSHLYVFNIAVIGAILQVMLFHVGSAAALKYNGDGWESWLAGNLDKDSVSWSEGPGM